ncbi:MAG: hypothetical protein NVS4B2_25880 [Chloroflexota bacterium]
MLVFLTEDLQDRNARTGCLQAVAPQDLSDGINARLDVHVPRLPLASVRVPLFYDTPTTPATWTSRNPLITLYKEA